MKRIFTLLCIVCITAAVSAQSEKRVKLYEVFTSSSCAPCNPGNAALDPVLDANIDEVAIIKYQMSWPGAGDPYYTAEGGSRRSFYSVNSVPKLFVNGDEYENSLQNFTASDYTNYANQFGPSKVKINLSHEVVGQTVNIDLSLEVLEALSAPAHRVLVGIVEKKTVENITTNGETEFHYVMKKMVPDQNGDFIIESNGLPADTVLEYTFSYEFQGSYNPSTTANTPVNHTQAHTVEEFEDLEVVAWIQDIQSPKEILQASATWIPTAPSSVAQIKKEGLFEVYPNPAQDVATIALDPSVSAGTILVHNVIGEVVLNQNINGQRKVNIQTNQLEAGVYLIQVNSDGARKAIKKLIVR